MVPIENDNSNFKLILERLLYPLLIKKSISKKNIHPFILNEKEEDLGLVAYEKELARLQDYYDISLLSSGEDSHIAGLFPYHSTIRDNSAFYIKTDDSPKPPPGRMSSSRKLLARSDTAILVFYGPEKKPAFDNFLDNSLSIEKCPARIVLEVKNIYILTDQKQNGE
jgi:6-phosphogluconolactonase